MHTLQNVWTDLGEMVIESYLLSKEQPSIHHITNYHFFPYVILCILGRFSVTFLSWIVEPEAQKVRREARQKFISRIRYKTKKLKFHFVFEIPHAEHKQELEESRGSLSGR